MSQIDLGNFSAFAFDFDGTLADTIATHNAARQKAFKEMAERTGDARFLDISLEIQAEAHRHGSNPVTIIGWALQASGIVTEIADARVMQTVDLKRQMYAKLCRAGLQQIPNAVEFAGRILDMSPGRVGITTTAYRDDEVVPFLKRYDLYQRIPDTRLVTFEDVGPDHLKPDPRAYELTLDRFGLITTPDKLLIFEDTPGGVASAKAAGAIAVAVMTTHDKDHFLAGDHAHRPDYIVSNFAELIKLTEA